VASIYGFEEADDTRFLVIELVEGRDLASRIGAGASRCVGKLKTVIPGCELAGQADAVYFARSAAPRKLSFQSQRLSLCVTRDIPSW
jgi:hypothetical protein